MRIQIWQTNICHYRTYPVSVKAPPAITPLTHGFVQSVQRLWRVCEHGGFDPPPAVRRKGMMTRDPDFFDDLPFLFIFISPESERYGAWISAGRPWATGKPSRVVVPTYRYAPPYAVTRPVFYAYLNAESLSPPCYSSSTRSMTSSELFFLLFVGAQNFFFFFAYTSISPPHTQQQQQPRPHLWIFCFRFRRPNKKYRKVYELRE